MHSTLPLRDAFSKATIPRVFAIIALLIPACSRGPELGNQRLIETLPTSHLRPQDLFTVEPVVLEHAWRRDVVSIEAGTGPQSLTLHYEGTNDATTLDALIVTTSSKNRLRLSLSFCTSDETVQLEPAAISGPLAARVYRFDLATNPAWAGTIEWLSLDVRGSIAGLVETPSVRGARYREAAERSAAAASNAWWVDIANVQRAARIALPGHPVRVTVTLPDHPQLLFSLGATGVLRTP